MSRITASVSVLVALTLALSPVLIHALGGGLPETASADGEITWSVEPAPTTDGQRRTFEYSVGPGTQIVDSVVVSNSGATAADFMLYATDAINEPSTGAFGLLAHSAKPTDVGGWVTLANSKITIQPGAQATVPFSMVIPSDAAPGDHVAGIVAAVLTTGTQSGAAVTLEQRVGARVYLKVSGVPKVGVEAVGLVSGYGPSFNPFAPGTLSIGYDVSNTGNLRMDVNQRIVITGPFGIPLGAFTPKPVVNILPRQTVRITADVPAIAALALAWSTVTLTPGEVGTADKPAATGSTATPTPSPTPTTAATSDAVVDTTASGFTVVSSTVTTLAISWTLLILVIIVIAVIYLIWRYLSGTRERMYLAIDEATHAAREQAIGASAAEEATGK